MTERKNMILPHARHKDLLVQELPDELLVYDLESHRAHCLNKTAALVWKRCDGLTSFSAVARDLSNEVSSPIDEDVVRLALDQLEKAHLLDGQIELKPRQDRVSRRKLIKTIGIAAAIPLVTSLTAPMIHAGVSACTFECMIHADCASIITGACTKCCNVNSPTGPIGTCVGPVVSPGPPVVCA